MMIGRRLSFVLNLVIFWITDASFASVVPLSDGMPELNQNINVECIGFVVGRYFVLMCMIWNAYVILRHCLV